MTKVKFQLDPSDKILLKRHLNKNGKGQEYFTKRVAAYSFNYVPRITGRLRTDITVKVNSITWNQPYARKQYYGHKKCSYWDKKMLSSKGETIINEVAKFCGGRSK